MKGDYDGDTAILIWEPDFVTSFKNANEKYSVEPPGLAKCFSRDNERVDDFLKRVASRSLDEKIIAMQQTLLRSLRDTSVVGIYSNLHDNAIHSLGYAHPRTVRLAYK